MTSRQRLALGLVVGAAALGVVGDMLFNGKPIGVNALLFAALFVALLGSLLRIGDVPMHQGRRWMVAPLLLFAGLLAWHDSPLLIATNLLALAGAVSLGALRRSRVRVASSEITDYVAGAAAVGAATFAGAIELMEKDVPWERIGREVRGRRGGAIARGLALGLPLVALFGGLFLAADAVFKSLVIASVPDFGQAWTHLLFAIGITWLSAGLLRDLLASRDAERLVSPEVVVSRLPRPRIGPTEVAAALGALNAVFAVFVFVQVRYLFGGQGLVEARAHLTFAEYARHGFFELVVVALLVLPVLLFASTKSSRSVRVLSWLLIAFVCIVIASALDRMRLYQREYGLTEFRVFSTGLILWLACIFALLAVTVVRGRPKGFALGTLAAGFAATLALNVVNPDALIARTNLARPNVDAVYLASLSDDAVPALLARLPALDPALRRSLAAALLRRSTEESGWTGWNASRTRAGALLRSHRAELVAAARAAG